MPYSLTETALRACFKWKRLTSRREPYVFLAAMPKSASTFLHRVLVELTGFETAYFASHYRNIEQELYLPRLIDAYNVPTVTQQHVRANRINLELLSEFGIRPIVLMRDVFDVLVSMRDHLIRERIDNLPSLYVLEDFSDYDESAQLDFVVAHMAPWLISFYVSWLAARSQSAIDALWLSYDEVTRDSPAALRRIMEFYGLDKEPDDIARALDRVKDRRKSEIRVNKGVSGRGRQLLADSQKARVREIARTYRGIDFSEIGL